MEVDLKRTVQKQATRARGRFARGESGNPTGRPTGAVNKAQREAKEFCSSIVDDLQYQAAFRSRAVKG